MEEFKMGNYNNFGQALAAGRVGEKLAGYG